MLISTHPLPPPLPSPQHSRWLHFTISHSGKSKIKTAGSLSMFIGFQTNVSLKEKLGRPVTAHNFLSSCTLTFTDIHLYLIKISSESKAVFLLTFSHKLALQVVSSVLCQKNGRFLSGGIILGFPLCCTDLFLYRITLPAVSCDAPPTLSYTSLELASRVLLSSKKPA